MAQTSIHIATANAGAEQHNRRTKALDYVRADLSRQNQTWEAQGFVSVAQSIEQAKTIIREKSGRSMQKNATPIREGVAVICDTTTMAELQEFCNRCQEKWGLKPLAIYTHLDEGHEIDGEWHGNKHAHILWQCYNDKTGRSIRLHRQDLAQMQTILAECLHMERGKSSDKEHLTAIQYKNQEEEKRGRKLIARNEELTEEQKQSEQTIEIQKQQIIQLKGNRYEAEEKLKRVRKDVRAAQTEKAAINFANALKKAAVATANYITDGFLHLMGISRQDAKIKQQAATIEQYKGRLEEAREASSRVLHKAYQSFFGFDEIQTPDEILMSKFKEEGQRYMSIKQQNYRMANTIERLENAAKQQNYQEQDIRIGRGR